MARAKGAKVLEDTTQDAAAQPEVAATEQVAKRKKNVNIKVEYLAETGELSGGIPENVIGFKISTANHNRTIRFDELPSHILYQMAAFGGNTVSRNEFNTTLNADDGDIDSAEEALITRLDGFAAGQWRSTGDGEGTGTPLVVDAIIRAYADKGKEGEELAALGEKALTIYRGLDKDGKSAQTKAWLAKPQIRAAYETIKAERAAAKAKAASAKAGAAPTEADDDLI